MFKNIIILAIRNIMRQKLFAVVNITGLAIGIAACFLILLYVDYEISYDKYHSKAEHIYRITEDRFLTETPRSFAESYSPVSKIIKNNFEKVTTLRIYPSEGIVATDSIKPKYEDAFFYSDNSIFKVFDFEFIKGSADNALAYPFSVVLTETTARKYFGTQNAYGRKLYFNNRFAFRVTGVIKDIPANSHFNCNFLASYSTVEQEFSAGNEWWVPAIYTYILIPNKLNTEKFRKKITQTIQKNIYDEFEGKRVFKLQKLTDIHLYSHLENEIQANNHIQYVYIFLAIAFAILMIAIFNFMNLSTAKALKRAKEIAIRKVSGANRWQIVIHSIAETIFITMISTVLSIAIIEILIPYFNQLTSLHLMPGAILDTNKIPLLILFVLLVGVCAGSYPALYISMFKPIETLKGKIRTRFSGIVVRRILVALQFFIATFIIASTLIVVKQLNYLVHKPLGFKSQNLLTIDIRKTVLPYMGDSLKNFLVSHPYIQSASFSSGIPGNPQTLELPYLLSDTTQRGSLSNILVFRTDDNFFDVFEIKMIGGRHFLSENKKDEENAFIINYTAAKHLGVKNVLNNKFTLIHPDTSGVRIKEGKVVGIVSDFHYESLHKKIKPLLLEISPNKDFYNYLTLKFVQRANKEVTKTELLDFINKFWQRYADNRPLNYMFLNKYINELYTSENKFATLAGFFSMLIIIISSLGLYGLVSYTSELRTKEIGLRKVFGAETESIILLILKEYLILIGIASVAAMPLFYYAGNKWIRNFAYHTTIDIWVFIATILLIMAIVIPLVVIKTIRIIRMNQVDALRYE